MKKILLNYLRCPVSSETFDIDIIIGDRENIIEGYLISKSRKLKYPILNNIPRFVEGSNYTDNFGMQWKLFSKTQLDSHSGKSISADRFWKATGWNISEMRNKWILDVGCGSGRFAEVALNSGAQVVALDYSSAVDSCWDNLKKNENLHVIRADIYFLPFLKNTFDFIYCLGVLQHTPDVKKAFNCLPPLLKKKGRLCVDVYCKSFKSIMHSKYLIRPITKNISREKLFNFLKKITPLMLKFSIFLDKIPLFGKILKRLIPVANYNGIYDLSKIQLKEWALLDTFDMLSAKYDNPLRKLEIFTLMKDSGMKSIEILHAGHLVARGIKDGE